MRHIVSGLSVEGVPIPDPPLSPPAPVIYDEDELLLHDSNAFNIEFQLDHIKDFDQALVNPMTNLFKALQSDGCRHEEYSYGSAHKHTQWCGASGLGQRIYPGSCY
jgi:hypothetical protein